MERRYDNINALRALSAIGIALMHYLSNMTEKPNYGYITTYLIPWMTQLVMLFFMVSAFGMCCGYYEQTKNGSLIPKKFYGRRYGRILPFFFLTTVIDLCMNFSFPSLAQGFMNATLLLGLLPVPKTDVIGVGWFLGTIFVFYMIFPFFVYLIDNKRKAWTILLLAFIVNNLCFYYFFTPSYGVGEDPGRMNILYSGIYLICGSLVYLYRDRIYRFSTKTATFIVPALVILFSIAYFALLPVTSGIHYVEILGYCLIFGLWLIYAVSPKKRWMSNRAMDFLSKYSMEIYLCHMMMFRVIEKTPLTSFISDPNIQYPVICVCGIGLSVLFSWLAIKSIDSAKAFVFRKTVKQ